MLILENTLLALPAISSRKSWDGNSTVWCRHQGSVLAAPETRKIAVKGAMSSQRLRTASTIQVQKTFFLVLMYIPRSQLLWDIFQRQPGSGRLFPTWWAEESLCWTHAGQKCHLGTFYGRFARPPCAFVITANAQTSMWGQSGEMLFLDVHSLSLLDSSLEQRVWGQKGKKWKQE